MPAVFVGKHPQSRCVDAARSPKFDDAFAALFVTAMLGVLAHGAVGQNQAIGDRVQQTKDGRLNLLDGQRRLLGPVIQIRHFAFRSQLLQDPVELGRAVRIGGSA
jgi:hypothetical protein